MSTGEDVTTLLARARQGDARAASMVVEVVYAELRRLAASYLRRERPDHTLQPTALVHEAYLRLGGQIPDVENRGHFFGVAAYLMRQVLVEHARAHKALKRNGAKAPLDDLVPMATPEQTDVIALDAALAKLATIDERQSRVVELRYFGGLAIGEIASLLGVSERTVKRDWELARVWLHREISRPA